MNRYDPIEHRYWIGELEVPSVTRLLPKKDFNMPAERLEMYRQLGIEQHELIKMFFQTVYPNRYEGKNRMLMALDRFVEKDAYKLGNLVCCERPLFSEEYLFAGTPDNVFENGIIDWKRSRVTKKDMALQHAGYDILAFENCFYRPVKRQWIMAWYDNFIDEFKSSEVYRPDAIETFLLHVTDYYLHNKINEYHARSNNGN